MKNVLQFIGAVLTGAIIITLLDTNPIITSVIDFEVFWRLGLLVLLILAVAETRLKVMGLFFFYYLIIAFYLGFACIQVKERNYGVEIYSPLGFKIDQADRVDTVYLRNQLYDEFGDLSTVKEEYFFLQSKDTVRIYNRLRMVLALKGQFSIIEQHQSRDIAVDLIKANGVIYSLDGEIVDDNWEPRKTPIIPIEHNNLW